MQPTAMPGLAWGMTMRRWMRSHPAPRSRAASIWLRSSDSMAFMIGNTMKRM